MKLKLGYGTSNSVSETERKIIKNTLYKGKYTKMLGCARLPPKVPGSPSYGICLLAILKDIVVLYVSRIM